jgi:hypothetical protein
LAEPNNKNNGNDANDYSNQVLFHYDS